MQSITYQTSSALLAMPQCLCGRRVGSTGPDGDIETGMLLPCGHIIGHLCLAVLAATTIACAYCATMIPENIVEVIQATTFNSKPHVGRLQYFQEPQELRRERILAFTHATPWIPETTEEAARTQPIRDLFPDLFPELSLREVIESLELVAFLSYDIDFILKFPSYMADSPILVQALYTRAEAESIALDAIQDRIEMLKYSIGDLRQVLDFEDGYFVKISPSTTEQLQEKAKQILGHLKRDEIETILSIALRPLHRHFDFDAREFVDDELEGGSYEYPNVEERRSFPMRAELWDPEDERNTFENDRCGHRDNDFRGDEEQEESNESEQYEDESEGDEEHEEDEGHQEHEEAGEDISHSTHDYDEEEEDEEEL